MKICFICPEYPQGPHGGVGAIVQLLARDLVARGHSVRVIGVYPENYPAPDYEEDQGVRVWRLRTRPGRWAWIRPWIRQYQLIKGWIDEKEIELVEAPDSRGWFACWPQLPTPLVLRANGANIYFAKVLGKQANRLTRWLELQAYRRADAVIAASEYTAQITHDLLDFAKKFHVIYNGMEIPAEPDETKRRKNKLIFSGTLNRKKGIIPLIKAAVALYQQGIDFTLDLYGKDTTEPGLGSMKAYARSLIPEQAQSHIVFKDAVPRSVLFKAYQEAQIAVFPSMAEAFSMAPMEAMACGCCTVYSRQTSAAELIEQGIDGWLVEPAQEEPLFATLKRLLADPALARQTGRHGREKIIRCFSKERMVEETLLFYQQTIAAFNQPDDLPDDES